MGSVGFYFKYAWRSVQRGGQRTFFAILCITVGVASIVALQTTGSTIQDAVAGDAKTDAGADVLVSTSLRFFTQQDLAKFDTLKQNGTITDYYGRASNLGFTVLKGDGGKSNAFGSFYSTFPVDPAKYPYYGKVDMASPGGKVLKDVLTGPNQIVINEKMASSLNAKVGDKIKVQGDSQGELQVVGILNSKAKSPDQQAEFLGYSYITAETAKPLFKAETLLPTDLFIKTTGTSAADDKARDAIKALSPQYEAQTATERNVQLKQAFQGIKDLLSYVGLVSLLIGSVGVVNTMLVVVGRRSTEIATIKALGMESSQTVQMFVIEALILGVFGSIFGVILGEVLALVTTQAAEGFVNQSLSYSFYWQPVVIGLIVGIVTSLVFGLLPAYSASKIPPAQVLRQKTNALPRISIIATILIILLMTVVMGVLAGVILNGNFVQGVLVAFVALVVCAILVLINSGILWLVGKIPLPFGLNYKMARRNLSRGRGKSATTMLVMMVGIFAMAVVLILASSLKDTIGSILETSFGYNLQVSSKDDQQADAIAASLQNKQVPGLEKYITLVDLNVRWVSANGVNADDLIARKKATTPANQRLDLPDMTNFSGLSQQDVLNLAKISAGQNFASDDQMILNKEAADAYGIKVGDKMLYRDLVTNQDINLTVSGIYENKSFFNFIDSAGTTVNKVRSIPGHTVQFAVTVAKGRIEEAQKYVQTTFPGAQATDLSFISTVINKLLDNFTAFPVLLAFLCLIAGAVLIANNVALAVLERRTEMGVMKSIGADSTRVLNIINWESVVVGFLGGLIGLGLAVTMASVLVQNFGTADNPAVLSISPLLSLGMIALAVGLALVATIGSAWGAAQEKPMVVLRYE